MSVLRFEKISVDNFSHFKGLMCQGSISGQCYCLSHRVEPKDLELDQAAAEKMQQMVLRKKVHGLLAFLENRAVAWVGVEPFPSLVGHDAFELLLDNDSFGAFGDKDWIIHCLFVHPGERQHGFTGVLVDQAIQYAVDRGAERVLAFPPPEDRARMMAPEEKYSGTLGLYLEKGFQNMGKLSSSSVLVVKSHFIQKPRLSLKTV